MPGMIARAQAWLRERLNIDPIVEFASHKSVPSWKGSFWYYFGGVALFLFIVQVVTGILLLMYYQPGEKTAFESVRFIVTKVKFGWLIRSIHSWAANLFILAIFIHMFSVFFTRAFRRPRELTWYSGFVLLGLAMGLGFSGHLLPWNTLAYFATKVGTTIVAVVPFIGEPIMQFLREGKDVTTATLTRFYGLHVAIFPAVFTAILGLHMLLVQTQGMHEPESWKTLPPERRKSMPFFPNFILRDLLLWLIVLNLLAILAVLFPWELGEKADPFAPAPEGIKPEWYFLFMYQALKYFPAKMGPMDGEVVGILLFGLAGLLWFLVPWWDAKTPKGSRNRTLNYVGIVVLLFMIVMTAIGVM
ncbi:MAG TPA: cytochrome bc complex cytochrome b subunit [Candidatus Eisenbacteria bacterium]|nr:cytochrome bc complex cytochrome b subunit [Candidatus Eisenbacteria bacterium]